MPTGFYKGNSENLKKARGMRKIIGMSGKKHTEKTKKKISIKKRGCISNRKGVILSQEIKEKISQANRGKNYGNVGENHCNWKGGITPIRKKLYFSNEYKLWRKSVFERDNWTCVFCGERGGIIHADHIKPWAYFPELRFAIDNGRTLCIDCHKKTDTYGVKAKKLLG